MFQYDAPIVLTIDEEITQLQPSRPLSELFPEETQRRADQAYQRLVTRSTRCDLVGLAWLGVVVVSLVALLLLARSRRQGLAFWTLSVAVLGPVGLLAWLIAACGRRPRALIETVGDLPPNVVGTVVALETAVLVPGVGQNVGLLLLALYCIPLAVRLFLYQASLLARPMGIGYARTVLRRLPAALISTNLAIDVYFSRISASRHKPSSNWPWFSRLSLN